MEQAGTVTWKELTGGMTETDENEFYESRSWAVQRQSRTQEETRGSVADRGSGFVRKKKKKTNLLCAVPIVNA